MAPNSPSASTPGRVSPLKDEEKVFALLTKTQSVTLTARLLGVSAPRLSIWLHREKRRGWWEAAKKAWSATLARERQRRYRAKRAKREGRTVLKREKARIKPTNPPCPLCHVGQKPTCR